MNFKSTLKSAGVAVLLSGMFAAPAFAWTGNSSNGTNGGNLSGTLHKTNDMWRASAIKGANVYNSADQQIGSVDGVLLNSTGSATDAVVSVGSYAGVGNKLVKVPLRKLKFEKSQNGNNGPANYSIVYPGATKQSLKNMSSFSYNTQS